MALCALSVLVACTSLAAEDGAAAPAVVNPVIVEYNFEGIPAYIPNWGAGYKGSYRPATGWKEPFKVTLDRENPHSGLACMSILLEPQIEEVVRVHSPGIPVPEALRGKNVQVEFYTRVEGLAEGAVGFGILQKDAEGATIGYVDHNPALAAIAVGEGWAKVVANGRLNSRATTIILMFTAEAAMPGGQLWVDDIVVLSAD